MKWKHPPITKIYEALGTVADGRIEMGDDSSGSDVSVKTAKIYSSSRNKFYDISYDRKANAIMCNDNASYWKGYLGYPAIAYLMAVGILSYEQDLGNILKGIAWKDINQKFKNDFEAALESILSSRTSEERDRLRVFSEKVDAEIAKLGLDMLGKKTLPPDGY